MWSSRRTSTFERETIMRNSILFSLLAISALGVCSQDAQAGCHSRYGCGRVRSCYTSRCYTPVCGIRTCNTGCYAPTFVPTCYSTPCVTTSYAPAVPAVVPLQPPVSYARHVRLQWNLPACPDLCHESLGFSFSNSGATVIPSSVWRHDGRSCLPQARPCRGLQDRGTPIPFI